MILVIDNNKTTYIEKYRLFYNAPDAIKYANDLGFSSGISENDLKLGVLNHVSAGLNCDVVVIKIDPYQSITPMSDHFGYGGC